MVLSKDSPYHKTCPNHPLLVDCAFYQDAMKEIDDDPYARHPLQGIRPAR